MKLVGQSEALYNCLSPAVTSASGSISVYQADDLPVEAKSCIAVSEGLNSQELVSKFIEKKAQHWIQNNQTWYENELLKAGHFCEQPISYFAGGAKGLVTDAIASHCIELSSKEEKPRLKQEVDNFVSATQSQNASDSAAIIAEELYMNALLDAPREAQKLGFARFEYSGNLKAVLELSRTEDQLVMSMIDPFGSLDCWKFIKRMDQVYKMGAGEVLNRGPGGAGLGCVIIFENCSSLFLGVNRQHQTQVSCVIPIGFSNRQRDKIFKSLHRIEIGAD